MFDVAKIISRNNATFYEYSSNKRVRVYPRIIVSVIVALIVSISARGPLEDLLAGAITVQAILIGFGFSVMFFLASGYKDSVGPKGDSIEDDLKGERLSQLSKEIFYNISYFNFVAMVSLSLAIFLLLPPAAEFASSIITEIGPKNADALNSFYRTSSATAYFVVVACFYFSVIESGYTFGRMVGRVGYLFEQKIQD